MIHVDNLRFQYPGSEILTLKGISFDIREGEIFGFLGPSGAGKSTAQKVLYKILKGYDGNVQVAGIDLESWDKTYLEKIGVGFELPNHYLKLTGKENLDLFASFYPNGQQRNVAELFEMVGMPEAIDQPVETYSKGMMMRLNFIRAIQHDPDILFFDEPTTGMDPVNAQKIKVHIAKLRKAGKTIFITTHSMQTAEELCDRVAFIVNGKLEVTDTPSHLKDKYGKETVKVELADGSRREFILKNIGENEEFLAFIKKDEVLHIHTQEASLEEVFIKVTGKSLKQ